MALTTGWYTSMAQLARIHALSDQDEAATFCATFPAELNSRRPASVFQRGSPARRANSVGDFCVANTTDCHVTVSAYARGDGHVDHVLDHVINGAADWPNAIFGHHRLLAGVRTLGEL